MNPTDVFDARALGAIARALPPHRDEDRLTDDEARRLGAELADELRREVYRPRPARMFRLPKPNRPGEMREVGKLARRDRVVQRAVLSVLQRGLGGLFPRCVCSYVPGRSALDVVRWVERKLAGGKLHVWSLDVVDFYPSLRHSLLSDSVSAVVPWRHIGELLLLAMCQPGIPGRSHPELGLIQGGLLSPWLSNLYLLGFDRARAPGLYRRYCDNLFLVGTPEKLLIEGWTVVRQLAALGLRARVDPARPAAPGRGIECLGYRVTAQGRRPGETSRRRFVDRLVARIRRGTADKALALLRGWRNYYGGSPVDRDPIPLEEVDSLLRRGRFREALDRLEAIRTVTQASFEVERENGSNSALPDAEWSLEDDEALLDAIGGDSDRHAVLTGAGREIHRGALSPGDLAAHRKGERDVAVLPVDRNGWAHVAVIDVDRPRADADNKAGQVASERHARGLAGAARRRGHAALVEDTGGRGHHVWVCLPRPVPAREATELLERVVDDVGGPPRDVRQEVFPAPPDRDPAIRLPLGLHPRTGRASNLLDENGRVIRAGEDLRRTLTPNPAWYDPSEKAPNVRSLAARQLLDGCPILGRLARKAVETRHLGHHERYTLASTLGHVPGGAEAVHTIIAWCDNYDYALTQGFLDRLTPRPLGCRRIHERHPELADRECQPPTPVAGLPYSSPVGLARGALGHQPRTAIVSSLDETERATDIERLLRGLARSLERVRGDTS